MESVRSEKNLRINFWKTFAYLYLPGHEKRKTYAMILGEVGKCRCNLGDTHLWYRENTIYHKKRPLTQIEFQSKFDATMVTTKKYTLKFGRMGDFRVKVKVYKNNELVAEGVAQTFLQCGHQRKTKGKMEVLERIACYFTARDYNLHKPNQIYNNSSNTRNR